MVAEAGAGWSRRPPRPVLWAGFLAVLLAAMVTAARIGDDNAGGAGPSPSPAPQARVLHVAPSGVDGQADGSQGSPFGSLAAAAATADAGDRIEVAEGNYPVTPAVVSQPGVTIAAAAGAQPVFDGSVPVTSMEIGGDGKARIPYQPMPTQPGQGMTAANLVEARFDASGPVGLAAGRGWRCVSEGGYSTPAPTAADPAGCPAGTRPTVLVGYYPDQVWVGDRSLSQVLDEALVGPGRFYVERSSETDAAPPLNTLVLDAADAADAGQVRVSSASEPLLRVTADRVTISGLRVRRISGDWSNPALLIGAVAGTRLIDMAVVDVAAIGVIVAGERASKTLARDTTISGLVVERAGWSALVATYTDDTLISSSRFLDSDPGSEFQEAPQRGAIKATRNDRMTVEDSEFAGNSAYALWLDQSNYEVTVARTRFVENVQAAVFFEISHGLTMVDNLVTGVRDGPSLRLVGSSGLTLVNNTIVGGEGGVAVLTDARSRDYSEGRPCSEHPTRYGEEGDLGLCNIPYASDLDRVRPGAFGGPGTVNQTPLLTWRPQLNLMLNNVIADPTGAGFCSRTTPFCVVGYTRWGGEITEVPLNTIVSATTVLDGNVYQSGAPIALLRAGPDQPGGVVADSLDALRGPSGLGSDYYGLDVEQHGLAGSGWVSAGGAPTDALTGRQGQAAPVPNDPALNAYVPAGSRTYGSSLAPPGDGAGADPDGGEESAPPTPA